MTLPAALTTALADRYRVERKLGEGGMATVYLAEDLRHHRKVALKVLRPELAALLGAERFLAEIRTTANLQHPHILPLHDSGQVESTVFYVMPFIEGESLRDRLKREKQLSIEDSVRLATQVAGALDYAHRHGVIHRDIKPENILLHDGQALVADFGIALATSSTGGTRMTETGVSLGTPHYMSPEQAMGERELTARSDVYALGCVTYEMLTGEPPFTGPTVQAILARVMTEEPRALSAERKSVPAAVEAAVAAALAKLPADRPASAARFAELLTAPAPALVSGARRPAARPWLRDPRSWLVLGATVALAVAAAVLARRGRGLDLSRVAVLQRSYRPDVIFNARLAPDGETVLYSASPQSIFPRLFVIRPDYPEPQPFGPDTAHLLAVSSTGELALLMQPAWLYHRAFTGTLARMPLGGGAPRELQAGVQDADWSPDGKELAILRRTGTGSVIEYPAGRARFSGDAVGWFSHLRVSPDGRRLAFFSHQRAVDDRGILIMLDTLGTVDTLTEQVAGLEGLAWTPDGRSLLFGAALAGGKYEVRRVRPGSPAARAYAAPGSLTMMDVGRNGRWLITRDDQPIRLLGRTPGAEEEREYTWLDNSFNPIISRDGTLLTFMDQSVHGGLWYSTMLRRMDGSPAVRLGEGSPLDISRDNRWVVARLAKAQPEFRLYPTGAGEARTLAWPGLEQVLSVSFWPDGRGLLVCGREPGRSQRCYRSPLEGGSIEPVSPDSIGSEVVVAPDGRRIVFRDGDTLWIQSLPDGAPRKLDWVRPNEVVSRWSPDGSALWVETRTGQTNVSLERVDLATGRRSQLLRISPPPSLRAFLTIQVTLADDPRAYVYSIWSFTSALYTVDGIP